LQQEDVLQLVELSERIRRDRQERIREIQWEREKLEDRKLREEKRREIRDVPYEEERIIERDIIYDGPRRAPRGYLR
jgi:hypothetical protein